MCAKGVFGLQGVGGIKRRPVTSPLCNVTSRIVLHDSTIIRGFKRVQMCSNGVHCVGSGVNCVGSGVNCVGFGVNCVGVSLGLKRLKRLKRLGLKRLELSIESPYPTKSPSITDPSAVGICSSPGVWTGLWVCVSRRAKNGPREAAEETKETPDVVGTLF